MTAFAPVVGLRNKAAACLQAGQAGHQPECAGSVQYLCSAAHTSTSAACRVCCSKEVSCRIILRLCKADAQSDTGNGSFYCLPRTSDASTEAGCPGLSLMLCYDLLAQEGTRIVLVCICFRDTPVAHMSHATADVCCDACLGNGMPRRAIPAWITVGDHGGKCLASISIAC